MALHNSLKSAKTLLQKQDYYVEVTNNEILQVALDDREPAFCFLAVDEGQFNGIIINFASDFPFASVAADIAISLMHVTPVTLGENFHLDAQGSISWGEEASIKGSLESSNILADIEPISQLKH